MNPTIADLLRLLEELAPGTLAEKWDNVGLLVGSTANPVKRILIGLDPTNTLVDEAVAVGADTIITHHPVIFKPLSAIDTGDPAGRLLQKALSGNISMIGCHTNLDSTMDGVNDVLAEKLGLEELSPLQPAGDEDASTGLGRIGRYSEPLTDRAFLRRVFDALQLDTVTVAGTLPSTITTVALCGGSGSDFTRTARKLGADVYLSAEIKHDIAIWAREAGFAVIDGTHYATEKPATFKLAAKLEKAAEKQGWNIDIRLTETETPPLVPVSKTTLEKKKP